MTKVLTFAADAVHKPVVVTVYPDTTPESSETFVLTLSAAVGATIVVGVGTGTILDDDSLSQTATFRLGPFALAPEGSPGSESNTLQMNIPKPTGAFVMTGISFELVHADGSLAGHHDVHLHHVVFIDQSGPDTLWTGMSNRFTGAGAERTNGFFPTGYAYKTGSTDQ